MNIACVLIPTGTPSTDTHATNLRKALLEQHAETPFTDIDAVSVWLHREHGNPRTVVRTNEAGTQITMSLKDKPFLTITCG